MAVHGRSTLRDLFDDSPTPHIAHPPRTHHRHFYVATDGSYRAEGGGLGAVIETRDGTRVSRVALPDAPPDNNVAEYRALHLGLDVLAARAPPDARVGVLVDHDDLAANVNHVVLAADHPDWEPSRPVSVPARSEHHWRGIRARIGDFEELRAARIDSRVNPAHPLANAPEQYAHVNARDERCVLPSSDVGTAATGARASDGRETEIPPPSRTERQASD
jgi:ribonuclease HI